MSHRLRTPDFIPPDCMPPDCTPGSSACRLARERPPQFLPV